MWKSRCYCRSCPTVMGLDDGIGPKISTVAFQHFSGNLYGLSDSLILLLVNASHASHFSIKFLTFCPYHERRNYLSMLLICSDQDVTTMQAPKLGLTFRALCPSFPYLLNKVSDTLFSYFHYFFLMFHNCSSLISVLVSLQNYSICFSVVPCMLVATPVQTIISLSMEQGYQ